MKTITLFRTGIFLASLTILFSCSKDNNSSGFTPDANTIYMRNSVFTPSNMQVTQGATVTFYNDDTMVHTATENNGLFDSGDIAPGSFFRYTFDAIGTYPYDCVHHSGMAGTVIVLGR